MRLSNRARAQDAQQSFDRLPNYFKLSARQLALLAWGALLVWALWMSGLGRQPLVNASGWRLVGQFWLAMFRPALDAVFMLRIAQATLVTLTFAICGTTLSLTLGFFGGIFTSQVWWDSCSPGTIGKRICQGLKLLLAIPRGIHELIWGLLLLNLMGIDPLVGVLAIAFPFGAITANVYADILDETPTSPLQNLLNSGVNPVVAFVYGHLPQALPNLMSYAFYRFECALRAAAVLGIIGVGGLGYEISLSLQSLRYEQLWTGFYALILLNGCVDLWSAKLRRTFGFVSRMDLSQTRQSRHRQIVHRASRQMSWLARLSAVGIVLAVPLSFWFSQLDWSRVMRVRSQLPIILTDLSPANVLPNFTLNLIPLALQTVAMSVLAITLASLGGMLLSFPAAQNIVLPGGLSEPMGGPNRLSFGHVSMLFSRLVLLFSRAIPAPILALIILYGLYPGIWPGALALAIHNLGILGRLMAEVNENTPAEPVRALRSLGASKAQLIAYGLLPINLTRFLAYSLYRWEVCLRETVIVGLVGAGGLGRLLTEQLSSFDNSALAATLTVFVLLTMGVDRFSVGLRNAVR